MISFHWTLPSRELTTGRSPPNVQAELRLCRVAEGSPEKQVEVALREGQGKEKRRCSLSFSDSSDHPKLKEEIGHVKYVRLSNEFQAFILLV